MGTYIPSYSYPNPMFQPAMRVIAAITNSFPVTITTTLNHLYVSGLIVRLDIPVGFGMQQANHLFGPITVTGNTTFTLPIDTTNFDTFMLPSSFPPGYQDAQTVPTGEISSILYASVRNVIPFNGA